MVSEKIDLEGRQYLSASVDLSERLMDSSKSSSLYRDEDDEDNQDVVLARNLDTQKLLNLKETDL